VCAIEDNSLAHLRVGVVLNGLAQILQAAKCYTAFVLFDPGMACSLPIALLGATPRPSFAAPLW